MLAVCARGPYCALPVLVRPRHLRSPVASLARRLAGCLSTTFLPLATAVVLWTPSACLKDW